ncbi:MAG: pantetheine-phosphate adenylyltransferase [bacterium]
MRACYAFSGDPITNGHIDIIKRSLEVFNHVTVAIGSNPNKRYLFSLNERTNMTKETLKGFGDKITVKAFNGLLVDFLRENCITHIIRGIRSTSDLEYEKELASINQTQDIGIDTWFLTSNKKLDVVSSSASKEIVKYIGKSDQYVPVYIKNKLEQKLLGVKLIGITGEIGAGKSYVSKVIETNYKAHYYNIVNIDIDTIGKKILTEYCEPIYREMRRKIMNWFTSVTKYEDSIVLDCEFDNLFLDPQKISNLIFKNKDRLDEYNNLTRDVIIFKIKSEIRRIIQNNKLPNDHRYLIIFVNSALLIEADLMSMVNNNIIFVNANEDVRIERLKNRGYTHEERLNRINSQLDIENKINKYDTRVDLDKYGNKLVIQNNEQNGSANNEIIKKFDAFLKTI